MHTFRRGFRVTVGVVVFGCTVVLPFCIGLDAAVQAPVFALIAAAGWAVTFGTRADSKLEGVLKAAVRVAAIAATTYSAYQWLLSVDAGTGVKLAAAALAIVAVIAFLVNISDIEATMAEQDIP